MSGVIYKETIKKDMNEISTICLCLANFVFFNVVEKNIVEALWEKLGKLCETKQAKTKVS